MQVCGARWSVGRRRVPIRDVVHGQRLRSNSAFGPTFVRSYQPAQPAFFYNRGTIQLGARGRFNHMAKLETSIRGLTVRSSKVGHIARQAFAGLVYLGIFGAFASVVFIAWLISIVIW